MTRGCTDRHADRQIMKTDKTVTETDTEVDTLTSVWQTDGQPDRWTRAEEQTFTYRSTVIDR
jgi:hypothetical protein